MMETDSKKEASFLRRFVGPVATSTVIFAWLVTFFICGPDDTAFSILNTLFSGLAFAGVVWTILLQKDELEKQREELELTRTVFKEQSMTSKKQRFETSFYQLIAVHTEKTQAYRLGSEHGIQALETLWGEVKGTAINEGFGDLLTGKFLSVFREIRKERKFMEYVPYSNHLFNVISMIDKTELVEPHEKVFYYNVLSNLLSHGELELAWIEAHEKGIHEHLTNVEFFKNRYDRPEDPGPSVGGAY